MSRRLRREQSHLDKRTPETGGRLRETDTQATTYVDCVYDNLHQLTRETKRNIVGSQDPYGQYTDDTRVYDYSYTFDEVGNRLTYKDEITQSQTSYTYNSMNQLTQAGNTSYTYDDNGNMASSTTNQQTTNYQWDCFGHLIKVDNPGDTTDVKFVYDGVGHRVKRWRQSGNETTYFVNDKTGDLVQLLAEVNSGGQTIARYIMGAALISQKRGGATYCYHFDALGSTRALTDASEVVQNTYEYDAYGNVLAKTENVTNPYQFATAFGYYADPDTGLLYLRARYYSPSIGRFISLDSYLGQANDPMSLHRYLYCRGNPLVWVDPSGYLGFSLLGLQISITWGTSGLGALAGAICNVIGAMLAGEKDWATLICAAFSGAIIGGISGGIMGSISADVIGGFAAFLAQGIANSLLSAANLVVHHIDFDELVPLQNRLIKPISKSNIHQNQCG